MEEEGRKAELRSTDCHRFPSIPATSASVRAVRPVICAATPIIQETYGDPAYLSNKPSFERGTTSFALAGATTLPVM